MAVKKGFKLTEVGEIPEDWDVTSFGEVAHILRGASPRPIEAYLTNNINGYNWIKIGDVNIDAKYIITTEEKIIKDGTYHSREVHKGDLLLSNSMSFGRPYILKIDGFVHDGWLVIQDYQKGFNTDFLYYLLCSSIILKQYNEKASGSSVLNLNKDLVSKVSLCYPSKIEQAAIAAALSDADSLISSLEQLIAKKRLIKQGAMQELLSGKKRLPGFERGWTILSFDKDVIIKARIGWQGLTTKEYNKNGDYLLITGTEFNKGAVIWSKCYYISEKRYMQDCNIQLHKEDILLTKDGTIGKTAFINEPPKPATLNSGIFVIRPKNKNIYPKFLYYILASHLFLDFLNSLQAGSTINHLYQKDIINFNFLYPYDRKEQAAIAAVLSDMDDEIAALEAKLEKARKIKEGMMAELLTGRIRLV